MKFGAAKIPTTFYIIAIIYLAYCFFFTPNFALTIPIVIFPLFIYRLFWLSNQINIIFWGMLLQWILPSAQLIYANFYAITLDEKLKVLPFGDAADTATLLNITGLYFFSLGLFVVVRTLRNCKTASSINQYPVRKIFYVYLGFSALVIFFGNIIWAFPGLVQFIYVFFYIKWGFFLVTFYAVHKYAENLRWYLYGFIFFELILGLSSFFAGQIVYIILFTGVAVMYIRPKVNIFTAVVAIIAVIAVVSYLIIWTAVKKEYRDYVSHGRATQTIQVSSEQARNKLIDLFINVDSKRFQDGFEQLIDRVGYIQFFAAAIKHVPLKTPYQNGDVYWSAVQHFAIPRFINPNKTVLDDSDHTSKFTGLHLLNGKNATSFSLGYITDAYVDFGPIGMHLLLFCVGMVFGYSFRYLVVKSPNDYWLTVLTGPFLIILNINGTDTKKVLGALVLYMVMIFLARKPIMRFIESYLRSRVK